MSEPNGREFREGLFSVNLVIFGLGYSIQAFVAQEGHRFAHVTATVRDAGKAQALAAAGLCERLEILPFDDAHSGEDRNGTVLRDRVGDADAVLVSVPPGAGDPVLDAWATHLADAPRLRWIGYLSTVGVYGDHGGAWVDEDTPCRPVSDRSLRRLSVEGQWLDFGRSHGKSVRIFRLSGIYGPGRNAIANLRAGTARRLIKPGQVFNRIHTADIAGALAAAIATGGDAETNAGRVYNLTDDEPAPPQDVVAHAARLIGCPVPPDVPFDPARLTPMAASFYGENKRVSNARLKRELDYRFRYPTYREALAAMALDQAA